MRQIRDSEDIRKWREELRLSLRELGDQAGIDRTHLWSIEDGRVQPRKNTLEKIQKALEYYQEKQNQLMDNNIIKDSVSNIDKHKNHAMLSFKLAELLNTAHRQGGKEREDQVTTALYSYILYLLNAMETSENNNQSLNI